MEPYKLKNNFGVKNRRKIKWGEKVYESMGAAAASLGITTPTLRKYIKLKIKIKGHEAKYVD